MSDVTPLSNGEINRRLTALEASAEEDSNAIKAINNRLVAGDLILKQIQGSIEKMEGYILWAVKIILTSVLLGILSLILKDPPRLAAPSSAEQPTRSSSFAPQR